MSQIVYRRKDFQSHLIEIRDFESTSICTSKNTKKLFQTYNFYGRHFLKLLKFFDFLTLFTACS